ncbi:YveK family protein [Bacillus sp. Marseille-Q3570]|uniref:YveK family protein n=1 Tax=Bacillus sp. Marseille-Q3570 TaxID=2963522 RepID=UPI0021B7C4E0|nr:Wzz/FepE/Etk N-terminal domain-containing protein [Bacillus sp. Marseille-Q3570]
MEETISLKEIFSTLTKRIKLILLITLVATAISGLVSYFVLTPIYQSSSQILVNQTNPDQQSIDVNQVRTNVEMINTYRVIIKSPTILEQVINELDLDMTVSQLTDSITVNSEQNSQVFSIAAQHPDPLTAVNIVNTVGDTFQKEIPNIMNVDNVSILSKAEVPDNPSPVNPKPLLNMAIAFVVGLMAGVGLAFLLEYLDNTVKTEQDIEKLLELPVIGVVPEMNEEEFQHARSRVSKARVGSESFEA